MHIDFDGVLKAILAAICAVCGFLFGDMDGLMIALVALIVAIANIVNINVIGVFFIVSYPNFVSYFIVFSDIS